MIARGASVAGFLLVVWTSVAYADGGIGGCMASSCHGSSESDVPMWQRAGKIWFDNDPHAQAYAILHNPSSDAILERLLGRPVANEAERGQILESRCVSCHASDSASIDMRPLGIHCGSCHGPLHAWGEDHYSQATRSKLRSRFEGTQRVPLPELSTQVQKCAECHIGSLQDVQSLKQVDHQLMAAGHPPMPFEFSNYLERYPAHWSPATQSDSDPWMRWRIGKLETAKARLQLLMDRCRMEGDWPEFTEYSCSSCHHELDSTGWRSHFKRPSVAVWDDWYFSYLELALDPIHENSQSTFASQLDRLRSTMESSTPDRTQAAKHAADLLELLQRESIEPAGAPSDRSSIRQSLRRHIGGDNPPNSWAPPDSWEQGVQWTLAVRAMTRSVDLPPPNISLGTDFYDGFFVSPETWRRGQRSPLEGSERFSPSALNDYRDSLRQQLGLQP